MIRRIHSDLGSFKTLDMKEGLNILLAEKSAQATDRQTRNGTGKTSAVELIHFVLGANAGRDSIFRSEALAPYTFGIDFDLNGERATAARSGKTHGRILVDSGDTSQWPAQPTPDRDGISSIPAAKWNTVLGSLLFRLSAGNDDDRGALFSPTFRTLFPYFVRRQNSGGFASYLAQSRMQQPWDQQVSVSYLLGLDWSVPQSFQVLREQEKTIKTLKKSLRGGILPGFRGTAASLRTELTSARSKAGRLKDQLDEFNVVPKYESIEKEVAALTRDMNKLGNENAADRQLLNQLRKSLELERPPPAEDLESLYREAGIVFSDVVIQKIQDAEKFHRTIIENRKAHLRSEVDGTELRIKERDEKKQTLEERRSELMGILSSGGALEQYTLLQEEYSRLSASAEGLHQQLQTAEKLESEKTKAEIERKQLQERLRQDFHEQKGILDEAIVLFEELSEILYEKERAGSLTVDATDNGPTFEVQIDAHRSHGISNMQIFCFDMMLAIMAARYGRTPGFLVHDSHLFDGVDERQVAKAIQIGQQQADRHGFQYLVTLDSDNLPTDCFGAGFDARQHILPIKLNDTRDGCLFGFRFN